MLSSLLSTICDINNSGNLFNKVNNMNMEKKSLASLQIKSLDSLDIPVNKCLNNLENYIYLFTK